MAESTSGGKKRKRATGAATKPAKKVVLDVPSQYATISSTLRAKHCPPVIANVPGACISNDTTFHSYLATNSTMSKKQLLVSGMERDLLLHSNNHLNLDYTAKENDRSSSKPTLIHYLGVYDPKTGNLDVVEAKTMVVRGVVRSKKVSTEPTMTPKKSYMDRKVDLGQAFGTKKAKKVLQNNVLNAISPRKKTNDPPTVIDSAGRAILDSVGAVTADMATREELEAVMDSAKPVPRAATDATEIEDVYDPAVLIGADILKLVPIREWQENVRRNESIKVPSRFVAGRVNTLAANEAAEDRLRVLSYMLYVILFYLHSKPGHERGSRKIPPRDKLKELLQPAPEAVIENIRRKFSDGGIMRKFHSELLMTHCCAFACIVDNFDVDTQNLRDDLRVDQKSINQYFHEIGARVKAISDKAEGRKIHIARLSLPLDFPKHKYIVQRR